jgi:hypothetical protein
MMRVTLLAIAFISFLSACGAGGAAESSSASIAADAVVTETESTSSQPAAEFGEVSNSAANRPSLVSERGGNTAVPIQANISLSKAEESHALDRKIIRNAELSLEAENPEDAQRKITAVAELRGGFVVESHQSSSEIKSATRDTVTMTVRVPADRFSDTLADIRNTSTRVVLETVKGQDVTEEFIDIEAQMKAKKALEQQFMEIMKRASTIGDALHVQSQLAAVRGEIERIEGRKRFLESQSSMSTIKIKLQTARVFAAATPSGSGERVSDSFTAGANVAMSVVLGLVTVLAGFLPIGLMFGLPALLFFRYVWKRRSGHLSVVEMAEDELKRA